LKVNIQKAAGWKEYDNLMTGQLKSQGYDGVILPDPDGTFVGYVFSPEQVEIVGRTKA
jgi:hypothetical protein